MHAAVLYQTSGQAGGRRWQAVAAGGAPPAGEGLPAPLPVSAAGSCNRHVITHATRGKPAGQGAVKAQQARGCGGGGSGKVWRCWLAGWLACPGQPQIAIDANWPAECAHRGQPPDACMRYLCPGLQTRRAWPMAQVGRCGTAIALSHGQSRPSPCTPHTPLSIARSPAQRMPQ